MAKTRFTITDTYQEVATGAAIMTIAVKGSGSLYLDEASNDVTAYVSNGLPGDQFEQSSAVSTFVRASGDGWQIIADGVL